MPLRTHFLLSVLMLVCRVILSTGTLPCLPPVVNDTHLGYFYELSGHPGEPLPLSLPGGACLVPRTLFLPGDVRLKFIAFSQAYSDASQYCLDNGMLLLFKIPSAAVQADIAAASDKACTTFGSDQWWMGFDDRDVEGTIRLASGFTHDPSSYSNWDLTDVNTEANDCVTFADCGSGRWKFGSCGVLRPFICQEDFPNVCSSYYAPHSDDCLKKVWELVGCLPEGLHHPDRLPSSEADTLKSLTYADLFTEMDTTKKGADDGKPEDQLNCYGIILPSGCAADVGPHTLECYRSAWDDVGCVPEGYGAPDNLTASEIATLNALNVKDVIATMNNTRQSADNANAVDQLNCFGMTYFSNCPTYYGNLTLDCLNTIWTDIVGCSDRGSGFPENTTSTHLSFLQHLNQRQARQQIQTVRDLADTPSVTNQMKCYGMEIPPGCAFDPPHTDSCLKHFFTNEVFCTTNGTHYPPSLNNTYKDSLYATADLHGVVDTMKTQALDQMKCYGTTFPDSCSFVPPHSDECLTALLDSVGCDAERGRIPPARNNTYKLLPIDKVTEELTSLRQNAQSSLATGMDAESCFGTDFVAFGNGSMMVVADELNYTEASKYCKKRSAYLFQIGSVSEQTLLATKLHNAEFLFGAKTWWLGLDDVKIEGTFQWVNGEFLEPGDYTNWNPSLPTSHLSKDCAIIEGDHDWKWNVDDCATSHSFICLFVNCGFPPETEDDESCSPPCSEHEDCIAGTCRCNEAFYDYNCSWTAGMNAAVEEKRFNKTFLFFKEKLTWQLATDVCTDTWGTLVVPNTSEKHDFILEKVLEGNLHLHTDALWMGMNDLEAEGKWKFATGEDVNFVSSFGDPTGGGQIPMYDYNTTSSDGRWHFYYEKPDLLLNRAEASTFCAKMGGHLPIIRDADEQNRIAQFLAKHSASWKAAFPVSEPLSHSSAWIGMTRKVGYPLEEMRWDDGVKANMHPDWYKTRGLPPPPAEIAEMFHMWKYPPSPDGVRFAGGKVVQEYCVAIGEDGLWFDWDCSAQFHVVCELGPVTVFERWTKGAQNYSEPNDAWCVEDCGAMRLDMLTWDRDHTGLKTEYWNDYVCNLKFGFACEVDLPSQCESYNPPLSYDCIRQISNEVGCDPDALPDNILKHLSKQTAGGLRSYYREIKEKVELPDSLFFELCSNPVMSLDDDELTWDIHAALDTDKLLEFQKVGESNVIYMLNKVPYQAAESICKSMGAVLPTLKNETFAKLLVKKIRDSDTFVDIAHWWIGLDDRDVKGLYQWSSGEPLDTKIGHYTNWSPSSRGTVEGNDCVAIEVSNTMMWVAEGCDTENGFMCVEVTCDYPASYGFVHRDECYHFRNDPLNREQNVYAKPFKEAQESCEKTNGQLSLADDEVTVMFLKNTITSQPNFTHESVARYWVSLLDKPSPSRHDPTVRDWKWVDGDEEKPFSLYRPFIRDGFKIENVDSVKSNPSRFSYEERCLYGDHQNHTYGNPFGNFNPHFYARSSSCDYNWHGGLSWVWTSSYHLLHLHTGRCLTAPFASSDKTPDSLFPGVRVLPCNLTDPNQHWICQSRNPFHLKLRTKSFSLLYDKVEPWDRAFMAGIHYKDDCKAMWRSLMDNQYLCDEKYHPGHNLFLAKRKKLEPYVKTATNCTEPNLTQPKFTNTLEMKLACSLRGGRLATKTDIQQAVADGFVDGCFCGYVENGLLGVNAHFDPVCSWVTGIATNSAGLFACSGNQTDSVWCYRGQHGTNKFGELQFAPWCGVLSVYDPDNFGLEERSCLSPQSFVCKQKMNNTCAAPMYPANSLPLSEDWRVGGDGVTFRCKGGYGLDADPLNLTVTSQCVNIFGEKRWNPDPALFDCLRLSCLDPSPVSDSTMVTSPVNVLPGNYKYSDTATYTCNERFALNGKAGSKRVTATCAANQKWKPAISSIKCSLVACGPPPRVVLANAIYDAVTHSLTYKCWKGYWVERGVLNVTGVMCNDSGVWSPDPNTLIVCKMISCPSLETPPNTRRVSIPSYRYLAKLSIQCEVGYSLVPADLQVYCNEFGEWAPTSKSGWCQNVTCPKPLLVPQHATLLSESRLTYIYTDKLQYKCNKQGFGMRKGFIMYNPYRPGCLSADPDGVSVVVSTRCLPESAEQTWLWFGQEHIKSVFTGKCLASAAIGIQLQRCNMKLAIQKWECTSLEGNSLLVVSKNTTMALRPQENGEGVELNSTITTASSWTASVQSFISICTSKRVFINYASMCSRYGKWNLPISELKCVIQRCPPLKQVSGATHSLIGGEPTYGTKAKYNCKPGYWLTHEVVEIELTCDENGNWFPPLDDFRCVELICPPPPPILYGVSSGWMWTYRSKITYTCIPGYWFESYNASVTETECGTDALWKPDPKTKLHCVRVTCPDPGEIPHATYFLATGEVAYDSVVEYKCDGGYHFEPKVRSKLFRCNLGGSFSPNPKRFSCKRTICSPPGHVSSATLIRTQTGDFVSGANVTYECINNYWINPTTYSVAIMCTHDAVWIPPARSIRCRAISCKRPQFVSNATLSGYSLLAGSIWEIRCQEGFWVEQSIKIKSVAITCHKAIVEWSPSNVTCKIARCPAPTPPDNAHAIFPQKTFIYKTVLLYQCNQGYKQRGIESITGFATTCQENGTWFPDPSEMHCEMKHCNFSVDYYSHGSIKYGYANKTVSNIGDVVTLTCDEGYWLMMEKGYKSFDFVCKEDELFHPNPIYLKCTAVECATPPSILHATLNAPYLTYKSNITYTCKEGFGSSHRSIPGTRWEMRCLDSGKWDKNFDIVQCKVINCGSPVHAENAHMQGYRFTFSSKVRYQCFKGYWLERDVFHFDVTCLANTSWDNPPPKCTIVNCIDPATVTSHAMIIGDSRSYLDLVTVHCDKGYWIKPGKTQATIRCLHTGKWDTRNDDFTCKAVLCPLLYSIPHATRGLTNYTKGAIVQYTCDRGYFVSRDKNYIKVLCGYDGRWFPQPKFIKCLHKTSFDCDPPSLNKNTQLFVESFNFNAMLNITCLNGFKLDHETDMIIAHCALNGSWIPNITAIECKVVECPEPAKIPNSNYVGSSYSYNSIVQVNCNEPHRIFVDYNGVTKKTHARSTTIKCDGDMKWKPSPSEVQCIDEGCGLVETPATMINTSSLQLTGFGSQVTFQCQDGKHIAEGVVAASVHCTESGLWTPDVNTLHCNNITCGFPSLPAHGTLIGSDLSYGSSVVFRCNEGYRMIVDDKILTEVELQCNRLGSWDSIDLLAECQRIVCSDPGNILSSRRQPEMFSNLFSIGSQVTYTCREGSWFNKEQISKIIECDTEGKWIPGKAVELTRCKEITCWFPPHVPYSIKPTDWSSKTTYRTGESVVYQCQEGRRFSVQPNTGNHYAVKCLEDGTWTELPDNLKCEQISCGIPPSIPHASFHIPTNLIVNSNAIYTCDGRYSITAVKGDVQFGFNTQCKMSGVWTPDPRSYVCEVAECQDPPYILHSHRMLADVSAGSFVNYSCETGYALSGIANVTGSARVEVECLRNGTWSLNVAALKCNIKTCGDPEPINNASLSYTGMTFRSTARYKCLLGYFFDQLATPRKSELQVVCGPDGRWTPSVEKQQCAAFDCGKPGQVKHARLVSESYLLGSRARYICYRGYVVDHGEDGYPSGSKPLATSILIKCQQTLSWEPKPKDVKCVLIQCVLPPKPLRAYYTRGRQGADGSKQFRFRDVVTISCAHGYVMSTTKLLSAVATCQADGKWSNDPADVNCVDITCPNPGPRPMTSHDGDSFHYLARVTYTCNRGYFISPGKSQFTIQCSYTGQWAPLLELQCKPVNCGNPGSVNNALRRDISGNYSVGSLVEYFCSPGFYVAAEQDAVGAWIVGDERRSSAKLLCSPTGNWQPRKAELHCSDRTSAVTLYELSPDGEIFHPWSYLIVPQGANYFPPVLEGAQGRIAGQLPNIENLIPACETIEVMAVHHLGHWIHITEDEVTTSHVPKLILETGVECGVMKMFDGEHDTYWMPEEAPYSPAYYKTWKGWIVSITLKRPHIVGSFRLHTSRNFENDVKTFYVHISTNGVSWKTLGPFQCIDATKRIEYFYDFKPFLARYIKLNITSTAMMRPPVVNRFGVFAASFDCVKPVTYTSDRFAIPVFLSTLVLCFSLLFIHGVRKDQKARWKRYIVTVPFAPESPLPSTHVYELSITTAWRDDHTDLLIKIYGSKGSTSIIWLRHDFTGMLRPGFTDRVTVQSPNIGLPTRIDVITVYKKHMIDIDKPNSVRSLSSVSQKLSIISSFLFRPLSLTSFVFASSATRSVKNIFRNTASVFQKPKGKHWAVAGISLRHGSTNEKWKAEVGEKRGNLSAGFVRRILGKHGVGFEHGVPQSFCFTSSFKPWHESTASVIFDNVCVVCRFIYKQHILAFLFSNRSSFVVRNFLAVEKLLIAFATISHSLLVLSLIHGFTDSSLYFASKQAPTSTLSTILHRSGSYSTAHMVALTSSCALLILLQFLVRVLAGKWTRKVEDCGSYFQGLNPIRSTAETIIAAVKSLFGSFVDRLPERMKQLFRGSVIDDDSEFGDFEEFGDERIMKDVGLVEYLEDTLQRKPVTAEEMDIVEEAAAKLCDLPKPQRLSSTEIIPVTMTPLYVDDDHDVTRMTSDKVEYSNSQKLFGAQGDDDNVKSPGFYFLNHYVGGVAPSSGVDLGDEDRTDEEAYSRGEFKEFECDNDELADYEQEPSSTVRYKRDESLQSLSSALPEAESPSYRKYLRSMTSGLGFLGYPATGTTTSWSENLCKMILTGATPSQSVAGDDLSCDESFRPNRSHVEALLGAKHQNYSSPLPSAYPRVADQISLPDSQGIMSHIVTHRIAPSKQKVEHKSGAVHSNRKSSDPTTHNGVIFRFLLATFCLAYSTLTFLYLLFSSFNCSGGVCLTVVVMFAVEVVTLLFVVMPLAGWLAILLEAFWMRGSYFHDLLRENAL